MPLIFLLALVAAAGPLALDNLRNPGDNVLTRSREDVTNELREIVADFHTKANVAVDATLQNAFGELLSALWDVLKRWIVSLFSGGGTPRRF
jgi:hypothetical protein